MKYNTNLYLIIPVTFACIEMMGISHSEGSQGDREKEVMRKRRETCLEEEQSMSTLPQIRHSHGNVNSSQ